MVAPFSDTSGVSLLVDGQCIDLAPSDVKAHKNGMEFLADHAFPTFLVLELSLSVPGCEQRGHCSGVVVASEPIAPGGRFKVTVLFLGLPEAPAPA